MVEAAAALVRLRPDLAVPENLVCLDLVLDPDFVPDPALDPALDPDPGLALAVVAVVLVLVVGGSAIRGLRQ